MDKKTLGVLALLLTATIWGITLPLMKVNLATIPPLTIAFLRFLIASILAVSFSELKGLKLKDAGLIGICAVFGISLHVGLLLIGLERTSAVDATFLIALSPIVTSLLAVLTLSEKINTSHFLGILFAFTGTFLYIVLPNLGSATTTINLGGNVLVLGSVLTSAIYVIWSKKLFETYHPSSIAAVSFVVGMISFFPGAIVEYVNNPVWVESVSLFNILSLLYLGIFSSFIAFTALEWGLSKVAVHVDATISYLTPIISILIATAFLGERVQNTFLVSVALIVFGIYLVSKHQPRLQRHFHSRTHKV